MKKLLISALVAVMVLGCGAVAFGATGDIAGPAFSDIAGHEAEAELTLLGALGVFTGESGLGGAVKPDDPLTRAQFCKVVVEAFGKGGMAAALGGLRPNFVDEVPAWAWGYVNVAVYMGIIKGYEDGTFKADAFVTYGEAITMLIRAVGGHDAQVGPGVWPYNYVFYGVDHGFNGPVDVSFTNLPTTRGDMAKMLFASMQINQLDAKGVELADDPATPANEDTAVLAGRIFEGIFDGVAVGGHDLNLGDPVYIVGASNYDSLLGLNVVAVTKAGKDIFLWKTEGSAITGVFEAPYTDSATGKTYLKLADGTKVPVNGFGDCDVKVNGMGGFTDTYLIAGDEVTITLDDDGFAVSAVALRWDLVIWDSVPTPDVYGWDYLQSVTKSTSTSDTQVEFDEYYGTLDIPKTTRVYINGELASRDDLAEYDVVKGATVGGLGISETDDLYALSATRTKVEGTVTGIRVVYPGPHHYVSVKVGDVTTEYEIDGVWGDCSTTPANGLHKFALDEDGLIFADELYEPGYPFVVVTGASKEVGATTKYFITVDNKGQSQTYETNGWSAHLMIGHAVLLEVDGGTGQATSLCDAASRHGVDENVTILAIGDGTLTIRYADTTIDLISTDYVYADSDGVIIDDLTDAVYIGLEGLAVGDTVDLFWEYADPTVGAASGYVYMLVRDDS